MTCLSQAGMQGEGQLVGTGNRLTKGKQDVRAVLLLF